MSQRTSREQEIRDISIAANSGEATKEQIARLDELIRDDPYLAHYAACLFDQQAALAWQGSMCERPDTHSTAAAGGDSGMARGRGQGENASVARRPALRSTWTWPTLAVGIAFLLGAVAPTALRPLPWSHSPEISGVAAPSQRAVEPTYEARFIRSTACLWANDSTGSREIGSWLLSGESLHLLEGLAEFTLEWSEGGSATLSLEGPAAMMLTSKGMPTLRFGRLTATINASYRPFVLETPVGRLVVSEFGSIGVSAFGNDGEIHVFDGAATLEPAWRTSSSQQNLPLKIDAGDAIRVQEGPGGELSITRHAPTRTTSSRN